MDIKDSPNIDFDPFNEDLLQTKDGIMVVDLEGKILVLNSVVKEMWNVPERAMKSRDAEQILKTFSERVRDKEWFLKGISDICNSKMMVSRVEIPLLGGKVLDCHSYPMIGADNKVHGRIWYSRDITEQKRVQDLRNLQHLMMENLAEGVVLTQSSDNTIVYTNKSFEKIFGYDRNELIGKKTSILNAPDQGRSPEDVSRSIRESIKNSGAWYGIIKNIRKNGEIIWTEMKTNSLDHSQYGKVNVSLQSDITDRVIVESRLRESERRYRIFFENSMDAIMVLTNDGTQVLEANKAAAELFDRTRIELLNINRNDLVDTADKRFKKLLRERELTGKYRGILKIIKKDGTTVECDVASVNFVGSDGFEQTHIVLHKR